MQYDSYCSCVGEDAKTRKTGSEGVRSVKLLPELTRCRDEQKGGVCNRDEEKDSLGLASKYKGYTGFLCVFNSYMGAHPVRSSG